ncbi:NAD(P)-binding protein [Aulographum hederae CBS 113979]|uniref:NAD(P)-binding protein n=1 Tax=Aulographum hederae CBS 113979 TaxID=1176131 RepID=A0A6G1H1U1_9PEZI|nr:NAD(P)-binding protein [Aulographum hederae CBS 113979]
MDQSTSRTPNQRMASSGKVIVLTGASRGIGLAVAHYLLKQKCNLVAVARSKESLEELRKQYPGQVQVLAADLSNHSFGTEAVDLAMQEWKKLDGLILNHGTLDPVKRIKDFEYDEWKNAFDVNVFSAIALMKAALPALRSSKGRIVLTSSGAAISAYTGWGAYGATKAVFNHLAMTLSVEETDITTISLRPGTVDTEMQRELREIHHENMDKKDADKFAELKRSGGLLKPEQPGHVIAKLVLDAPRRLSGRFVSWNDKDLTDFQEA